MVSTLVAAQALAADSPRLAKQYCNAATSGTWRMYTLDESAASSAERRVLRVTASRNTVSTPTHSALSHVAHAKAGPLKPPGPKQWASSNLSSHRSDVHSQVLLLRFRPRAPCAVDRNAGGRRDPVA